MGKRLYLTLYALAALAPVGAKADVLIDGCRMTPEVAAKYAPDSAGPAILAELHCAAMGITPLNEFGLAPDGRGIFAQERQKGLGVTELGGEAKPIVLPIDPTLHGVGNTVGGAFRWSDDSRFIWGVTQEFAQPSHFATSALAPIRIGRDGTITPVQSPHFEGDLDGVSWIDGRGLALVGVGFRGDFYLPPHANPNPVLAIVDFAKPSIRTSVSLRGLNPRAAPGKIAAVSVSAMSRLSTGEARILLRVGGPPPIWMMWIEGQPPKLMELPLSGDPFPPAVSFVPGGDQLLIQPRLSASGMICEHNPNCPPPTPVTGPMVALYDLPSGTMIWQIEATASVFANGVEMSVSPDGRYAVINVPAGPDQYPRAGLISLADGRVLQTIRGPWNSRCQSGFSPDGRSFWLNGGGLVAVYRLVGT